ncbi:hypothetical protein IMAU40072_00670 [Lactiplantibacillus plantarum]|uniref:DUF3102 domain-containing protein n=1 Tax=Lactiplantibacillus plantarum TaxID=1590 RepID=UPI001C9E6AF8|nr:DUF3102 domain-containing protein [Lactiplantibacillus plantarum]MCG0593760.1 hypothetical protein [Lactiplantibacillus plantarum]MCG0623050.1 hypothetical protein [Lactiplantibacillus plantarum]MCG0750037.1 hypothetical protein [Lactiplantibacillus plantarum]MCG0758654.1 hypothetical protein [Lactiplantibacillus plantarum]MCG0885754.1 hypothetical protein [Lactiplantibacillus plantarum]
MNEITPEGGKEMQEVALSNDLTQITTEIKSYQSMAGQSIFEIGRRLKWVKENDLAHGEYEKWLKSVGVDKTFANRAVKIVDGLGESNVATSQHLGVEALYQIATLPEEERQKLHRLESGEEKTPDEMTVRELRELKKQLKHREEELDDRNAELEQLRNQKPKVVEKEVEVEKIPDDYYLVKGKAENLQDVTDQLDKDNHQLRSELSAMEASIKEHSSSDDHADDYKEQVNHLKKEIASLDRVKRVSEALDKFMADTALTSLTDDFKQVSSQPEVSQSLSSDIKAVKKWCELALADLSENTIIEGDFNDEQ